MSNFTVTPTTTILGSISNNTTTTNGPAISYVTEPFGLRIVRLFLYTVIFFIAVIGNILVMLVVYKTPSLRSVTGYMIANLAVADLAVALLCIPVTLIYFELGTWRFGYAVCKILPFVQAISVMGSVGTLTVISVDRYRCIVHTFATRPSMTVLKYLVTLIWAVSLVTALPIVGVMTLVDSYGTGVQCRELWPEMYYKTIYNILSFCLTYAVPLLIMCWLYIGIAKALSKVVKEGANREGFTNQKKKDKVVKMLFSLVIAYATCYLPNHVIFLWAEFGDGQQNKYINVLYSYSILLVYTNSAMNPVLYAFMGNKFKDGFKRLLCCQRFPTLARTRSRSMTYRNQTSVHVVENAE